MTRTPSLVRWRFALLLAFIAVAVAQLRDPASARRLPPNAMSAYSIMYAFQGGCDGENPYAALLPANNGIFYGTTFFGGCGSEAGAGTVFELIPSGRGFEERQLFGFPNNALPGGSNPVAPLIMNASGALFGTTSNGGGNMKAGTVFKLTPGNPTYQESVLVTFGRGSGGGAFPLAGLLADGSGRLYGTTSVDGDCFEGTAFKVRGAQFFNVVHDFGCSPDGAGSVASLVAGANGTLYGTTVGGGAYGRGTVFELAPGQNGYTESVLYSFRGRSDGAEPQAALIAAKNGVLFGTTAFGGGPCNSSSHYGCGTVFSLKRAGSGYTERILYAFRGGNDGAQPVASVIRGARDALYGTTRSGGTSGYGTVYKLTPVQGEYVESILHSFQGGSDGANPAGSLVMERGVLYGTTVAGGGASTCNGGCGTVFRVTE
jgi:uncharacterized repeat protein (TIGR03803 family)